MKQIRAGLHEQALEGASTHKGKPGIGIVFYFGIDDPGDAVAAAKERLGA